MRFNVLLIALLLLVTIGALNYTSLYLIGIDIRVSPLPKIVNLTISSLVLLIGIMTLCLKRNVVNYAPLNLYIILILFLTFIGLIFNKPIEYIPSAIRFFSYYLAATLAYFFLKENSLATFIKLLKGFLILNVAIALIFGYLEVIIGDVQFINGAYRYSGTFKFHHLGNAMYLAMLLILWFELYVVAKKSVWAIIVFLLLFNLFLNTHSRLLMVVLFFSYCLFYILKTRSAVKFIKIGGGIFVVAISLYFLIINTEISPRLKTVFLSEKSLKDPSTMERIEITINTVKNMEFYEKVIGIGLGGFNKFYEAETGREDVAAHNNFLLFFAEGGLVGLFFFISYQAAVFWAIFNLIRYKLEKIFHIDFQRLLFIALFVFEIGCFLLNNYYFYCSQLIIWLLFGTFIYLRNYRFNI
jgi:hypothetical protein